MTEHKIVWMISTPRSRSTAVLRSIQTRGDFQIFHEPFQLAYNMWYSPPSVCIWYNNNASKTYGEALDRIFEASKHGNVFVKDMSFTFRDCLSNIDDPRLRNNKNIYYIVLLRNPSHSIVSCYNRIGEEQFESIKTRANDFLGHETIYDACIRIQSVNGIHLIKSEELCTNGETVIQELCSYIGIDFIPESMKWKDLGDCFEGLEEWNEIKWKSGIYHWHDEAIHSTSFFPAKGYKVDTNGSPTLEEIENLDHRKLLFEIYEKSIVSYKSIVNLLVRVSISIERY